MISKRIKASNYTLLQIPSMYFPLILFCLLAFLSDIESLKTKGKSVSRQQNNTYLQEPNTNSAVFSSVAKNNEAAGGKLYGIVNKNRYKSKGSRNSTRGTTPNANSSGSNTTSSSTSASITTSIEDNDFDESFITSSTKLSSRIYQLFEPSSHSSATGIKVITENSNVDIVVGKRGPQNGDKGSSGNAINDGVRIIMECYAPFPVQWIYVGDGMPEISTNTSIISGKRKSLHLKGEYFTATAALGFNRNLQESDTGEYVCRNVHNPDESIYYYVYVPGKSLFTSEKGREVKVIENQLVTRIPCSVTSPDVHVTLQKKVNGFYQCPHKTSITFSPKKGFTLVLKDEVVEKLNTPETGLVEYICVAGLNSSYQFLEFQLTKPEAKEIVLWAAESHEILEDDSLEPDGNYNGNGIYGRSDNPCFPNPCGPNSSCRQIRGNKFPICQCRLGYDGSPPQCRRDKPPCDPNPCGSNSRCREIPGTNLPHCSCLPAYVGRPPDCRPECILHEDCPRSMSCINQQCGDPCSDFCGEGANCQVKDHVPICTCPPGYSGDPKRYGKCGRTRSPSVTYFPPRPAYPSGDKDTPLPNESTLPSAEAGSQSFPCEPWPCGPFSDCRPVGPNAHCTCAVGYLGIPPNCRPECRAHADCSVERSCIESKCRDPCLFSRTRCGNNAKCGTVSHKAECRCTPGFRGDPLRECFRMGSTTNNNQQQNNHGQGHYHEYPPVSPGAGTSGTGSEQEYPQSPSSSTSIFPPSMRPDNPITGGGSFYPPQGSPGSGEYPGSGSDSGEFIPPPPRPRPRPPPPSNSHQQPGQDQSQSDFPCRKSPCGQNALCSFRNQTVGCKCPEGWTGLGSDPYIECRKSMSSSPCDICGPHSQCRVRKNEHTVCTCAPGKIGMPPNCRNNLCRDNEDCPDDLACRRGRCEDPCRRGSGCGENAVCKGMKHLAVCACLNAPDRDPLYGCSPGFKYGESYYYPMSIG